VSHKYFVAINLFVIVLVFGTIFYISPKGPEEKIYERRPVFEWTGYATKIIIDDNKAFSSPEIVEVKGNQYIPDKNLDFGDYFWKLKGIYETKPKNFNLDSEVAIKLYKEEELNLENDGNTKLNVSIKDRENEITGQIVLDLGEIRVVKENSDINAKQHE